MAWSPKRRRSVRLPQGGYAWGGRAVRFSKLPKREKFRWRQIWGRKARKTWLSHRAEILADIAAAEVPLPRGEHRIKGMRAFAADAVEHRSVREHIEVVADLGFERHPDAGRGYWMVTYEWPDDDRSDPGEPFQSNVGYSWESNPKRGVNRAKDYFEEVLEAPQTLGRLGPEHPSRGRGRAVLRRVHLVLMPARRVRRRK